MDISRPYQRRFKLFYVYCGNNPIAFVDVYGLSGTLIIHANDGHAWVSYQPDGGEMKQYGQMQPAKGFLIGLWEILVFHFQEN